MLREAAACTQGRRALEEQILLLEVPCEEEAERLRMEQVALLAVSRAAVHPVRRRQHPWALAVQGPQAEAVQ